MTKQEVLELIKDYKFLAINHKKERVIIITNEVEEGYNGYSLTWDNEGYSLSPFFICSTSIGWAENVYDFTKNIDEALSYFYLWNIN